MGGGGRDGHRHCCISHKPPVDGGGGIVVRRWRRCRSPLLLFLAATIVARPLGASSCHHAALNGCLTDLHLGVLLPSLAHPLTLACSRPSASHTLRHCRALLSPLVLPTGRFSEAGHSCRPPIGLGGVALISTPGVPCAVPPDVAVGVACCLM